jgi:glutamate dehydrogenase
MITADPGKRAQVLSEITDILKRNAPEAEREIILSFAAVIFGETPDRIALALPAEALAARILSHYRFVAHEVIPPTQLYKGVPGIHVSAWNPSETQSRTFGGGSGLPVETTVVETHTKDAPFVFESLRNYFSKAGLRLFSATHPILTVRRMWERVSWIGGPHEEGSREVYCHFQIEPVDSKERLRRIEYEIFSVLKCVLLAVEDFQEMLRIEGETAMRLQSLSGDEVETKSARAFLNWLAADNYIFMGTAPYLFDAEGLPRRIHEGVTGVFRDEALLPVVFPGLIEEIESHILAAREDRGLVGLDYCENDSAIYHLEPIDYIIVREWKPDGSFKGLTLFLGRFARSAFSQSADNIPILREKIEWIQAESGQLHNSHAYRDIRSTFNRIPLRELFYAPAASLKVLIEEIVFMTGDDDLVVHCRKGERYEVVIVAFSRSRYSYEAEAGLTQDFSDTFGPVSFHTAAECGTLNILLFYFDAGRLEHAIEAETVRRITLPRVTSWERRVLSELEASFGERAGRRLFSRYVRPESRSGLYREVTDPRLVPDDVRHLTNAIRTLQNLGLLVAEELRIPLMLPENRKCFLYRLEIEAPPQRIDALEKAEARFVEAMRALDEDRASDDPLNGLILDAGLTWREVALIRTLRNHLLQIRPHYNVETVNGVLLRNSRVARALFDAFSCRYDPGFDQDRSEAIEDGDRGVQRALESVRSLAEDEVLRALHNLICSSRRTNYYQSPERPVIAVKVESLKVEGMPAPRPMYEIYVHSPLLEGVHLRGGRVARGGIRWSDRLDDFRTEILGLMKTQMVKNAVIIPVGSKGGFVLKGSVPRRPALDTYLIEHYSAYVSGLLDVTDNMVEGEIRHPPEVVRYDGDDPYLVVAADKGTAHLSDTANAVSAHYGFWLGDAFASGGSHGYDHKKVGITARGAWECVKHHFRVLGSDIQTEAFTVCGIGDMSGDVFGNGVLQSRTMKLVAAFNHVHIFIDPDPDLERSYSERERLFKLPQSAWSDYDPSSISKGGGVFERSAKEIIATPEMRRLLDIKAERVSGEELIRRILTARVDLLYNGGIGTYVKASTEENADVADRANDRVRVNGADIRARVVAEGGNLGFTQEGRIEYWGHGGLLNTDAIDNSGGVDMSDHEVNIKILLDMLVKRGVLTGGEARNRMLAEMTEEVAGLVLADNELQSRALTLDGMRSRTNLKEFLDGIESMVSTGIIRRGEDDIPTRRQLREIGLQNRGVPRPVLAVLLAHTKMWAFNAVLQSGFPDSSLGRDFLHDYFPKRVREEYAAHLEDHVLRREIVATTVVNHVVNYGGIMLFSRLMPATQDGIGAVIEAYVTVESASGARDLRREILSANMAAETEHQLLLEIELALESSVKSLLLGKPNAREAAILDVIRARMAAVLESPR